MAILELSKHSKSQGNRAGKQKAIIEAESKAELKEIPPTYRRYPLHSFEEQ